MMPHKKTKRFQEHLDWVYEGGVPVWERFDTVQRVVSMAACIVDGNLVVGNRHFCPVMSLMLDALHLTEEQTHNHDVRTEQGFVDQYGVYMTRQEAWTVAKEAGQIKEVFQEGVLYSECYL
jgi:hypothetical protein